MPCLHPKTVVQASTQAVALKTGQIIGHQLVARVNCAVCGIQFNFKDLPISLDIALKPSANDVGTELRIPIAPGRLDYSKN